MRFPATSYSAEVVALMGLACDRAWQWLREQGHWTGEFDANEVRNALALQVMAAVAHGERDPDRLTARALHAIDADKFPAPTSLFPEHGGR